MGANEIAENFILKTLWSKVPGSRFPKLNDIMIAEMETLDLAKDVLTKADEEDLSTTGFLRKEIQDWLRSSAQTHGIGMIRSRSRKAIFRDCKTNGLRQLERLINDLSIYAWNSYHDLHQPARHPSHTFLPEGVRDIDRTKMPGFCAFWAKTPEIEHREKKLRYAKKHTKAKACAPRLCNCKKCIPERVI